MKITDIHEANTRLLELVECAMRGEDVIIRWAGKPIIQLVPTQRDESARVGGQWKRRVSIAADFDDLPDDISQAFEIDPS